SGVTDKLYPLFIELTRVDQAMLGFFLKDGISWWKNEEGTYLPPEMDPDYLNYLRTLQTWYIDELIHPETFVMTADGSVEKVREFIIQDLVGAIIGWHGRDIRQPIYDAL